MAGKFLKPGAIVDTLRSEQQTNAIRKRLGLTKHPVEVTSCGCPDPNCGAWHTIVTERTIPTTEECMTLIATDNKTRKISKKHGGPLGP
jgi:hypothetical protein